MPPVGLRGESFGVFHRESGKVHGQVLHFLHAIFLEGQGANAFSAGLFRITGIERGGEGLGGVLVQLGQGRDRILVGRDHWRQPRHQKRTDQPEREQGSQSQSRRPAAGGDAHDQDDHRDQIDAVARQHQREPLKPECRRIALQEDDRRDTADEEDDEENSAAQGQRSSPQQRGGRNACSQLLPEKLPCAFAREGRKSRQHEHEWRKDRQCSGHCERREAGERGIGIGRRTTGRMLPMRFEPNQRADVVQHAGIEHRQSRNRFERVPPEMRCIVRIDHALGFPALGIDLLRRDTVGRPPHLPGEAVAERDRDHRENQAGEKGHPSLAEQQRALIPDDG